MNEVNKIGGEMFIKLKRINYFAVLGKYLIIVKYGLFRVLLIGICN